MILTFIQRLIGYYYCYCIVFFVFSLFLKTSMPKHFLLCAFVGKLRVYVFARLVHVVLLQDISNATAIPFFRAYVVNIMNIIYTVTSLPVAYLLLLNNISMCNKIFFRDFDTART